MNMLGAATPATDVVTSGSGVVELDEIMRLIPHRYPFLFVDRIVEVVHGHSGVGIKNVTCNEPFFVGHFPGRPIMPGMLIIEAMAQTSGVLVAHALQSGDDGVSVLFMSVAGAKFRRPVVPGDQLRLHCQPDNRRGNVWRYRGVARVDGKVVAEALYTAQVISNRKDA